MDVLTDTLRGVQSRNQIYGRLELTAPWGMRIEAPSRITFYALSRGSAVLETARQRLDLSTGDLVFLRAGLTHTLRDRPKTRAVPVAEVYAQRGGRCGGLVRYGGDGAPTTIVSGGFSFETTSYDPLVAQLPELLYVPGSDELATRWLESTLKFMASEMHAEEPGYELVASRLADVLFVQALRSHVRSTCDAGGWLRAISDAELGIAFQRMHEKPDEPWTVETLARVASMSRSAFAARFKAMLGLAPLTYLTRWRMHRAAELLSTSRATMTAIANAVGYGTDAAFVKTFKRHFGETPGAYRRRLRARATLPALDRSRSSSS